MIRLTRLNHMSLVLNSDLIETIEVTPDTVISLTTGQKLVVLESAGEVVRRVLEFRQAIQGGTLLCPHLVDGSDERAAARASAAHPVELHGRDTPRS